jgi:hypothetical protein
MEFSKQIIDDIFKCYSVNALNIDSKTQLIFAAEGDGACYMYSGKGFSDKRTLWEGEGGTMSIVTVPDKEGYFFVSKGFFSMVNSEASGVFLLRYKKGGYIENRIIDIPYLHRFEVLTIKKKRYFIGASLHSGKVDKEDWSNPGKIYIGEIPYDLDAKMSIKLTVLKEGLYKNHGFNKGKWKGLEAVYVASEEGVIAIIPPQKGNDEWQTEQIFTHPVSDVAAFDIDSDEALEFALLSPFHGNQFSIYKFIDGAYKSVYTYEVPMDFYHGIYADNFNGVPSFVIGARKDDQQLFIVQYNKESEQFESTVIDSGVGPSNVRIIHTNEGDIIMSANRQIGQAAIYREKL